MLKQQESSGRALKRSSKDEKIGVYYPNVLPFSTFGLLQFVTMMNLHRCPNIVGHTMLQCTTVCCCVYSSESLEDTFRMPGLRKSGGAEGLHGNEYSNIT